MPMGTAVAAARRSAFGATLAEGEPSSRWPPQAICHPPRSQIRRRHARLSVLLLRAAPTCTGWISAVGIGAIRGGATLPEKLAAGATRDGSCETGMPWCTSKICDFLKSVTVGSLKPLPGSIGRPLGTELCCEPIIALTTCDRRVGRRAHVTVQRCAQCAVQPQRSERAAAFSFTRSAGSASQVSVLWARAPMISPQHLQQAACG
jgi:hypothetical protein